MTVKSSATAVALLVSLSSPALGHTLYGAEAGFGAGFMHPLFGADHLLAMVAVGIWAAMSGGRALRVALASFTGTMLLGYVLGISGVAVPYVEPMIAASVLALGLLIVSGSKAGAPASVLLIAVFALFHGVAHGAEVPLLGTTLAYAAGFACASVLLQACGAVMAAWSRAGTRLAGAPIAAVGCWMLAQALL
jgi:urease accessory protein